MFLEVQVYFHQNTPKLYLLFLLWAYHRKTCITNALKQCCKLVYVYTKFENFGIFSKCLVYNFLISYIRNIWYIFRRYDIQYGNRENTVW